MILKNASILIVDDDADVLTAVQLLIKKEAKEIVTEKSPEHLPRLLAKQVFDVILLDMNFSASINTGNEGFFWLKEIQRMRPGLPVIMITAYGDIDLAIRSLKEGATDFIVKPWHNEKFISTIREALKGKTHDAPSGPKQLPGNEEMLGQSELIRSVLQKADKVAPTDANILLLGENGTGKDVLAKIIHQLSTRSEKPFIKVDVGALTETLFESELFGHKKGAFTDAREDRAGRFEIAAGGTLFLDEIGNISLQQQAKLLSVLQNRQVMRLGSNISVPLDIRLICATNLPLSELANENRFRKDLIYRINTVDLTLPPLRNRGNDILLLAHHFCRVYSDKYMKPVLELDEKAKVKLSNHQFPGNVRELQYIIERAVIMTEGDVIKADDLIFSPIEFVSIESRTEDELKLSAVEKNTILRVIEKNNGNISKAAKELGITRTALYRRLSKYGI